MMPGGPLICATMTDSDRQPAKTYALSKAEPEGRIVNRFQRVVLWVIAVPFLLAGVILGEVAIYGVSYVADVLHALGLGWFTAGLTRMVEGLLK
ncbi:hypothetical protein AYO47_06550 [Planctomyces sp. SCGC AG-212-M04]|nr:hypothetical protein AYO47_06550 [Planctomyces sp. SCGC AG-212-M04]